MCGCIIADDSIQTWKLMFEYQLVKLGLHNLLVLGNKSIH